MTAEPEERQQSELELELERVPDHGEVVLIITDKGGVQYHLLYRLRRDPLTYVPSQVAHDFARTISGLAMNNFGHVSDITVENSGGRTTIRAIGSRVCLPGGFITFYFKPALIVGKLLGQCDLHPKIEQPELQPDPV